MNTRQIIVEAGYAVMREKPFSRITVQDILDKGHFSRKTFYRYFKDKHELMNMYYEEYVTNHILQQYDGHNWRYIQTKIIDFVMKNREYFLNVTTYTGQNSFMDFLYNYTVNFYTRVMLHNRRKTELTQKEKLKIDYITAGAIAILIKALQSESDLTAEDYSNLICDMMPDEFYTFKD